MVAPKGLQRVKQYPAGDGATVKVRNVRVEVVDAISVNNTYNTGTSMEFDDVVVYAVDDQGKRIKNLKRSLAEKVRAMEAKNKAAEAADPEHAPPGDVLEFRRHVNIREMRLKLGPLADSPADGLDANPVEMTSPVQMLITTQVDASNGNWTLAHPPYFRSTTTLQTYPASHSTCGSTGLPLKAHYDVRLSADAFELVIRPQFFRRGLPTLYSPTALALPLPPLAPRKPVEMSMSWSVFTPKETKSGKHLRSLARLEEIRQSRRTRWPRNAMTFVLKAPRAVGGLAKHGLGFVASPVRGLARRRQVKGSSGNGGGADKEGGLDEARSRGKAKSKARAKADDEGDVDDEEDEDYETDEVEDRDVAAVRTRLLK